MSLRAEQGVCRRCATPVEPGSSLCEEHKAYLRERYAARKDSARCAEACGRKAAKGKTRCKTCLAVRAEKARQRRALAAAKESA